MSELPDGNDTAPTLGRLAYAALAAGAVLYVLALWVEVYVDTRRAADVGIDSFAESHRRWRLRTAFLFLVWTVLGGFTLPLGFGWLFLIPAYLWYLGRVLAGIVFYLRGRPIGMRRRYKPGSGRSPYFRLKRQQPREM